MRDYKGFTPRQRMSNLYKVKQLIQDGVLPSPYNLKCERCGQDKGIREYHCSDYSNGTAIENLHCLCYKCHRMLHVYELGETHKYYKNAKEYFDNIDKGLRYKPVMNYKSFNWHYENKNWGHTDETRPTTDFKSTMG